MEASSILKTLGELPIGARILVRTKTDWRTAVVCRRTEEKATLAVCSPSGRTYRLHRLLESEVVFDGFLPILKIESVDSWRENFTKYDCRW